MWRLAAVALAATLSVTWTVGARAAQIGGSAGSLDLVGNEASGSFTVHVDYSVYDGLDAGDPLGVTSDMQLVFQISHQGTGGTAPVLNTGRFTVFAPDVNDPIPFYTSITSIPQGGTVTPSLMDIDPPPAAPPNRGEFFFEDGLQNPLFAPGDVSDLLVLTAARGSLNVDVVIEMNHTQPQVHADTTIRLVPEPATASLLLLGAVSVLRRRRS